MKKEARIPGTKLMGRGIFERKIVEDDLFEINRLIKILGRHLEKFEEAYNRKDHLKFNLIKREMLQIQRKIHGLIK